jgi:UDP-glucose 4-epimerase
MKKVLITGGFGFVGSRLIPHLRAKGIETVVLEHPAAPVPLALSDIEVLRADITDEASMAAARRPGIDAVLHLAAQSSGPRSFSVPALDVKLNVLGTVNTINWCLENQVERLVFASSFVVYGDHPEREALDEDVACRPKSVYAGSKLACEHLLMNYAQPKGIRWNALRMFNVYGPGQDITKPDQGVVGIFMNMLMQRDSVQVKGSLERFRDLVFIEDVIAAWDECLHKGVPNHVYNLGSGRKTTFSQLIRAIARTLGKEDKLNIEELPGTPGDMMGCYADMTRAATEFGFRPKVELAEGLATMYEWVGRTRAGAAK